MPIGEANTTSLHVRRATPDDYAAYTALFPELGVDDPLPNRETWSSVQVPATWVAVLDEQVIGYCYVTEYVDSGHVRNIVVAASARRLGVGALLMNTAAEHLRVAGKRSWRLNVKPENHAARALYTRLGLQAEYASTALSLAWSSLSMLPAGEARVRELSPERDAEHERRFELPRGLLATVRVPGRVLFEAVATTSEQVLGLSAFSPDFPGAFPFRVAELTALLPLLRAMRALVPDHRYVALVIENDERLAALLTGAGASVRHEILHLSGAL